MSPIAGQMIRSQPEHGEVLVEAMEMRLSELGLQPEKNKLVFFFGKKCYFHIKINFNKLT